MTGTAQITVVILTFNRPERCRETVLANAKALQGYQAEILVVDNAPGKLSLPDQVENIPVRIRTMPRNLGAEARNAALSESSAEFLLFMDDDAYIQSNHVEAMLAAFHDSAQTGVVSFRIFNGEQEEASLLPTVFHGCTVGIRRAALEKAGGYPKGYMYYAEEYHLAFAIMQAGYSVVFVNADPAVQHARDTSGRDKTHIVYRLITNNARLFTSFLPWHVWPSAMADMIQRYRLVADKENARPGYSKALLKMPFSILRGLCERRAMSNELFGRIALRQQMRDAAAACDTAPVVLCGTGRFPRYWKQLLEQEDLTVAAFLDTNSCWKGRQIDGIPVLQSFEQLPKGAYNLLTGHSSFSETAHWIQKLQTSGFQCVKSEENAQTTEKDATKKAENLCERCQIAVFKQG